MSASGSSSDGGTDFVGLILVVVGGILAGLYTTWMGQAKGEWENVWLQYSVWGLLILPWTFVLATVDNLGDVFSGAHHSAIIAAVGFGFLWGWGSVLFGTAVSMVGDSLTFTIVLGLTAALGSVLPLLVQHTSEAGERKGIFNFAGLATVLIGILLTSVAGRQREADLAVRRDSGDEEEYSDTEDDISPRRPTVGGRSAQSVTSTRSTLSVPFVGRVEVKPPRNSAFTKGLIVCVASGLLSPCLNFALSFGKNINDRAEDLGTAKSLAGNCVLALAVSGGFVANAAVCAYKLKTRGSYRYFLRDAEDTSVEPCSAIKTVLIAFSMGVMWFFGTALYNIGADMIGDLGTVLGWPLFMDGMILTANVSGVLRGEWKGTSVRAKGYMAAALLVLLGAVVVIGAGS